MDKVEVAFHLSVAFVVLAAIGLGAYGLLVISLALMKVLA